MKIGKALKMKKLRRENTPESTAKNAGIAVKNIPGLLKTRDGSTLLEVLVGLVVLVIALLSAMSCLAGAMQLINDTGNDRYMMITASSKADIRKFKTSTDPSVTIRVPIKGYKQLNDSGSVVDGSEFIIPITGFYHEAVSEFNPNVMVKVFEARRIDIPEELE